MENSDLEKDIEAIKTITDTIFKAAKKVAQETSRPYRSADNAYRALVNCAVSLAKGLNMSNQEVLDDVKITLDVFSEAEGEIEEKDLN